MKIYKVEKKVYIYWLDAYRSGFIMKERYFLNYDNAIEWGEKDLDLWENSCSKMVPIDKEYKRGKYSIIEIETAD